MAKALGERKDSVWRAIAERSVAHWKAQQEARESVRRGRLLRLDVIPQTLVQEVDAFYTRRRYLPDGAALLEALFCINTYVFDVCDTTPYLLYESAVPGCGKTTSLERPSVRAPISEPMQVPPHFIAASTATTRRGCWMKPRSCRPAATEPSSC
jgi:hypothetical protein